jgi:TraM recognition site of TraD and TraG
MSLADDARVLVGTEIQPTGKVHLGRRLTLTQHVRSELDAGFGFSTGLPDDGVLAPFEDPLPGFHAGDVSRQDFTLELEDGGAELFIEDAGLTMSYGIFGAPGSGKTTLMLRLLRQLLALDADDADRRPGALILDPKAALIEKLGELAAAAGRADDLVVINAHELAERDEFVNVIDCDLDSSELARALVLAARSAGVGASEDYWFGAWQNIFSAAIHLLDWLGTTVLTLRELLEAVLIVQEPEDALINRPAERRIQTLAREAKTRLHELDESEQPEARAAINQIQVFFAQKADSVATVENLITQAFGEFLRRRTQRYSPTVLKGASRTAFYDQMIDDGKIVLVSISPSEPGLAKVLCTLVKNLFMQSMRSRLDRVRSGRLRNFQRPVVLACDEYSQIASEIPGQVGDGDFFSIARSTGCMGLLATQSVNVLEASALEQNWRSIFSNFGAKIFMRAADNETVEEATKLAGEIESRETSLGSSSGAQGLGSSTQSNFKERKALPGRVLTQLIGTGQGVVLGSLDGRRVASTSIFQVPFD